MSQSHIQATTANQIQSFLDVHAVAVLNFHSNPLCLKKAAHYGVGCLKIDINLADDLKEQFNVKTVPCTFLVEGKYSNVVEHFEGDSEEKLESIFVKAVALKNEIQEHLQTKEREKAT